MVHGGPLLESVHQASCISTQSSTSGGSPLFKSADPDAGVQASPTLPANNGGSVLKCAQAVHAVYPSVSGGCPPLDSSSSDRTIEGRLIHLKHMHHSSPMKPSLESEVYGIWLHKDILNACSHDCVKTNLRLKYLVCCNYGYM